MKKQLLTLVLVLLIFQVAKSQVQKVETYLVGTKITYYANQCGNTIPEAQGKISFCDSQNNLGVVEASYGLSYRGISDVVSNYYNNDEMFITEAGVSIRKTDGSWDNIPEFTGPRSNLNYDGPQMRKVIVNKEGLMFFYHGFNHGLHYLDLTTKTYNTLSYATETGISKSNYTHSFAYDAVNNVTYIMAQAGGGTGYKVYKYENNTFSYLGGVPATVTGENSYSKLIVANDALYFGTSTGLYKLNKNTIALEASYFTDSSQYIVYVKDVVNDGNGNLWLANTNTNDAAIYKFNMSSEAITTFQLAKNTTANYSFDNLDIDDNGTVWATAGNLSGFVELIPTENNPTWTVRSMTDIDDLGFHMTYSPSVVAKFKNKIYILVTNNGYSQDIANYEAIVNDNGVWSGISDDEPDNLSDKMAIRYSFAYPDANGMWWYNYMDGGIMTYISNEDKFSKQYRLGTSVSFILDDDGKPVIGGGGAHEIKKVYSPYVAKMPALSTNDITQFRKYKDQIWVYGRTARKIFVYKHNQLIQTFNLDDTTYNTWYDFTPDINGNVFFAKRLGNNDIEFRKFDTNTETTSTFVSTTYLGIIKELIPLPNGNVAVICSSGIFLFNGSTLTVIGKDLYADLSNIQAGVSDINGKIYLLGSGKIISIENPEASMPTFSTLQVSGTSGVVPYNSFYSPSTLAIDANGAFWSHASNKWFKITTENTAPQFLNEGTTFGITGTIYLDINENNQFDASEVFANQKVTLKTSSGKIYETYTINDGSYYFPYFEGLGAYEITLPVLSPYVVAPERQRKFNVTNLEANTTVNTIKLLSKNIESLLVKSSSKQGAWAFTRSNFDNTFTTAVGNISYTKTFNNVTFDYVFFNKDAGSNNLLPNIKEVKVTKLQPISAFHIIDELTIEPRGHKWKTNVNSDSYTASVVTLTPTITTLADTTKISFTLPTINPLDTYVLEVKTELFTASSNGAVISYGVSKASSPEFGDGIPGQTTVILIPIQPNVPNGFPGFGSPYINPDDVYAEPPYQDLADVYSEPPYDTRIRSSYDPNDKLVNPGVPDALNEISLDEKWFTYTVRFQNEGNFSAKDIFVVDSLDQKFDKYSLTMLESSHSLSIETIKSNNQNIIKFNFNNIYLDYKANNELASQGYLKYMIKAKENVAIDDIMENRAAIYFDQNEPVITNLTKHKFIEKTLSVPLFSKSSNGIKFWPNPVDNVIYLQLDNNVPFNLSVFNLLGQQVLKQNQSASSTFLNVSNLSKGLYFLSITPEKAKPQTIKFIKN